MRSQNRPKPNYFKTFLSNYLAKYKDILKQPNHVARLKELEVDIKFCIDKFKKENSLELNHNGVEVNGVTFNLSSQNGLEIGIY